MSDDTSDLVPLPNAEVLDDKPGPKVGEWYWIKPDKKGGRILACVTKIGSNYAKLTSEVEEKTWRYHFDDPLWEDPDARELNAEQIIRDNVNECGREVQRLLGEVQELTSRLALSQGHVPETQALSVRGDQDPDMKAYSTALSTAKDKTLPELFREIEIANSLMARWMGAQATPLRAQAAAAEHVISTINDRIFSVELYAGLVETVHQLQEGAAAPRNAKIHIFQRRHYMDEECLAHYQTGGLELSKIADFNAWLLKPDNLNRVLPYPRSIVAFQVRRHVKERPSWEIRDIMSAWNRISEDESDKFTYLFLRNGEQVYCLRTKIDFDEKLFPDINPQKPGEKLWGRNLHGWKVVGQAERDAIIKDEASKYGRKSYSGDWAPFDRSSVYYDDMAHRVKQDISAHNRIALLVQGLLDRSPVFQPHPPWKIWDPEGFDQALVPIKDLDKALVAGDKPDFEAYRAKANASIGVGSVTVGQQKKWQAKEGEKEVDRLHRDWRQHSFHEIDYARNNFEPYGNPGPGVLARVAKFSPKKGEVTFAWTRERAKGDGLPLPVSFTCSTKGLLNVSAYTPGDFKQFFADPRTREEYLKWAPLLIEAEEYHTGNRPVPDLVPIPKQKKKSSPEGRERYRRQKARKSAIGKVVKLSEEVTIGSGKTFPAGSIWLVIGSYERSWCNGVNLRKVEADGNGVVSYTNPREAILNIEAESLVITDMDPPKKPEDAFLVGEDDDDDDAESEDPDDSEEESDEEEEEEDEDDDNFQG